MPPLDHLNTDFLGSLQGAGFDPAAVESWSTPICTPTMSAGTPWEGDGAGSPTFPNARYLMADADYRHFHPDNVAQRPAPRTEVEAASAGGSPDCVRGQHSSRGRADPIVVRRPSAH